MISSFQAQNLIVCIFKQSVLQEDLNVAEIESFLQSIGESVALENELSHGPTPILVYTTGLVRFSSSFCHSSMTDALCIRPEARQESVAGSTMHTIIIINQPQSFQNRWIMASFRGARNLIYAVINTAINSCMHGGRNAIAGIKFHIQSRDEEK